ncbi:MAG: hypothetical protein AB1498_13355 [bacterium]
MKKYLMLFLLMNVLVFTSGVHAVPIISYTEKDLGNGSWQYDYSFYNSINDSYLSGVWLDFYNDVDVTGLSLPTGWDGLVWMGTNTTSFLEAHSIDMTYDIAPGNYLMGYNFEVNYRLGDIDYLSHRGVFSTFTDD